VKAKGKAKAKAKGKATTKLELKAKAKLKISEPKAKAKPAVKKKYSKAAKKNTDVKEKMPDGPADKKARLVYDQNTGFGSVSVSIPGNMKRRQQDKEKLNTKGFKGHGVKYG
jgi:hypothetical protein